MTNRTLIIILVVAIFAFEKCDSEHKYVETCVGQYGSQSVIDSLVRRYNFNNALYFAQSYPRSRPPMNISCDTIHLVIKSDTIPFSYNDTFAISVAKIFFSDSANKHVKCLKIELIDYWPAVGSAEVNFTVDRVFLQTGFSPRIPPDIDDAPFKIEEESRLTQYSNGGTEKGIHIIVKIEQDYQNVQKLAAKLRNQYDSLIKKDQLSLLDIDIVVDLPADKLCTGKTYKFFYRKANKNM